MADNDILYGEKPAIAKTAGCKTKNSLKKLPH